jgi:glycolate oxidase FAD binding subunit
MAVVVSTEALLAEAALHSGAGTVRAAVAADTIDGVRPRLVATPTSQEGLAATLAWATAERLQVLVRGGGTKLTWGASVERVDVALSTTALASVVEHRHGDLTATVEAGATLAQVNAVLAAHRQWLPLDGPWPERATVGGIIATNDSGPQRHRHGAPRDLIIGVTLARSDGQLAKAGGIVVKNVAGYDLSRLLTGSFGCLGVIVSATFKLAPVAPASRTVVVDVESLDALFPLIDQLQGSGLTPSALELEFPPARLLVRFESVEDAVVQQADEAVRLASAWGCARAAAGDAERDLWTRHARLWEGSATLVKLSTLPTELLPTLTRLGSLAVASELRVAATGRAGLGVVDVKLEGAAEGQARCITALRAGLPIGRGSAVIRRGEPDLRQRIDPWGPIGDGFRVMQAVKQRFDPNRTINPGRGPGGL